MSGFREDSTPKFRYWGTTEWSVCPIVCFMVVTLFGNVGANPTPSLTERAPLLPGKFTHREPDRSYNDFTSFSHSCLRIRQHHFPTGNSYCRSGLEEKGFIRFKKQPIKMFPCSAQFRTEYTDAGYTVPASSWATQSSELEPQAEQDFQVTSDFRCLRF